ncbi:efflux transporter outer membrane subunit [Desulfurivibrio sp. C05AmB]|jgi:outer membrane protein, multidrug efflux system|uniref:efflux transporter outer membrane subunit n=1 Tax=Desulfurivibrio sp. C05AmB TaxID=3374371 RepID=UPI00376F2AA0
MPKVILPLIFLLFAGGCALGPDYQRPEVASPVEYRHSPAQDETWQQAMPADDLPKGEWWRLYRDPILDQLQEQAAANNLELRAALARLEQARALVGISEADLLPRLDLQPSAQRGRTPADLSPLGQTMTTTTLNLPLNLGYEVDLWGRLRRLSEAAGADFAAGAAEVENFRLILHGEVARTYFALRTLDGEIELLGKTVELRRENLRLMASRYQHGISDRLDLSRTETEVAVAEAEMIALRQRRSEVEHGLALLVGEAPGNFIQAADPAPAPTPPLVKPGLPAELLQRRPDVAGAERRLMAANARIGAAEAAFFPAIRLTGAAGFGSSELSTLLNSGNRFWNFGPQLSLPVFDGGRNRARLEQAQAVHQEALAQYQQTILQAFREVEDALTALKHLAAQQEAQQRAAASARETVTLAHHRYRAGLVSYLEVIDSERSALTLERAVLLTDGQQLQANIALVKALGGGWEE